MPIIKAENISKTFSTGKYVVKAVDNLSFALEEGQSMCIVGSSGSGKSTLLHILGGLDDPSSGRVEVAGKDLAKLNDRELSDFRNKTIGFVFQFFYLQDYLTAKENVAIPMLLNGLDRGQAEHRADELLNKVGLAERATHIPSKLSGGEQQRIAIARALANEPKVILADEPTGNLDEKNALKVMELLKSIADNGVSVVVVTHDKALTKYFPKIVNLKKT
ncbi:MAG: ABC transporter ATP-binding protein [Patescibacteria group bacterium]